MYVQGSSGYGSRYPYAAKGGGGAGSGVDAQKTRCRWRINRPELPGSISAEYWNGNSTPEEQNQTSLHFPAVCHFFIAPRGYAPVFSTCTSRAWQLILRRAPERPHPTCAAFTVELCKQGE